MIFHPTALKGACVITPERRLDERGFFARAWCERELEAQGLCGRFVQSSVSFSVRRGTLRGMHYQAAPFEEIKLVRCTAGAVYDVIIDLRPDSPTFMQHAAAFLSAENRATMYVPAGVAHGFQTLEDGTEVLYHMSAFHEPEAARGVRWNDPAFGVDWPPDERTISARDRSYPDFVPGARR